MKIYTFHSGGSSTPFNPDATVKGTDGKPTKALDLHLELVQQSGRRDVYVLDNKGRELELAVA